MQSVTHPAPGAGLAAGQGRADLPFPSHLEANATLDGQAGNRNMINQFIWVAVLLWCDATAWLLAAVNACSGDASAEHSHVGEDGMSA